MPVLIRLSGPRTEEQLVLEGPVLRLGRGRGNDVLFDRERERVVSNFHAEIRHEHGVYVLYDLQSSHGTFLNDQRITRVQLRSRDVIGLGQLLGGPTLQFFPRVEALQPAEPTLAGPSRPLPSPAPAPGLPPPSELRPGTIPSERASARPEFTLPDPEPSQTRVSSGHSREQERGWIDDAPAESTRQQRRPGQAASSAPDQARAARADRDRLRREAPPSVSSDPTREGGGPLRPAAPSPGPSSPAPAPAPHRGKGQPALGPEIPLEISPPTAPVGKQTLTGLSLDELESRGHVRPGALLEPVVIPPPWVQSLRTVRHQAARRQKQVAESVRAGGRRLLERGRLLLRREDREARLHERHLQAETRRPGPLRDEHAADPGRSPSRALDASRRPDPELDPESGNAGPTGRWSAPVGWRGNAQARGPATAAPPAKEDASPEYFKPFVLEQAIKEESNVGGWSLGTWLMMVLVLIVMPALVILFQDDVLDFLSRGTPMLEPELAGRPMGAAAFSPPGAANPDLRRQVSELRGRLRLVPVVESVEGDKVLQLMRPLLRDLGESPEFVPPELVQQVRDELDRIRLEKTFKLEFNRCQRFRPGVAQELEKLGFPQVFAYIPWASTGYDPAYRDLEGDRIGLWGLQSDVARRHGLRIDAPDERLEPRRATLAAVSYLVDLVGEVRGQSFSLALVSYPEGTLAARHLLSRRSSWRIDQINLWYFWREDLLRAAQRAFLARVLAAALVDGSPEQFDLPRRSDE